jgi:hypothetical protein
MEKASLRHSPYERHTAFTIKNLCNHLHTTQKNALYLPRGTYLHYENVNLSVTDMMQYPTAAFQAQP